MDWNSWENETETHIDYLVNELAPNQEIDWKADSFDIDALIVPDDVQAEEFDWDSLAVDSDQDVSEEQEAGDEILAQSQVDTTKSELINQMNQAGDDLMERMMGIAKNVMK